MQRKKGHATEDRCTKSNVSFCFCEWKRADSCTSQQQDGRLVGIANSTLAFSTTQEDFSNTERSNLCHIPNDDLMSLSKAGLTPGTAAVKDMHPPCEGLHLP